DDGAGPEAHRKKALEEERGRRMIRRFVVAVEGLTPQEVKTLNDYLHEFGAYWHWIDNFWLLVVTQEREVSASKIRERIAQMNGKARSLVLEVGEDIDWSGRGSPRTDGKNQHDWLARNWSQIAES